MGESPKKKAPKQRHKGDSNKSKGYAPAARSTTIRQDAAMLHIPVRHNKYTVSDNNLYRRCAFGSRKSALHECTVCKVHLHAPLASEARFNTSGRDWECFAEYHTAEGYKLPHESTSSTSPSPSMSTKEKAARRSRSPRAPLG